MQKYQQRICMDWGAEGFQKLQIKEKTPLT